MLETAYPTLASNMGFTYKSGRQAASPGGQPAWRPGAQPYSVYKGERWTHCVRVCHGAALASAALRNGAPGHEEGRSAFCNQ